MSISRHLLARILFHLPLLLLPMVVFLSMGGALLYWHAGRTLQQESAEIAEHAFRQFENILDQVDETAQAALALAGQPCDQAESRLKQLVTTNPFVRTANLTFDKSIYCSSLFGASRFQPPDAERFGNEKLWLVAGTPVKPNSPVMGYHLESGQWGALIATDGEHLRQILQSVGQNAVMFLAVNEAWLGAEGQVHSMPVMNGLIAQREITSEKYPFTIRAAFPIKAQWRYLFLHYLPYLGLLALAGLATGIAFHINAPKRDFKRGLDAGEFEPYYQPLARVSDNTWYGVEVLARWRHPRKGLIEPNIFIPLAENSGLIVPMTRVLMARVADELSANLESLPAGFHVGINISAAHCRDLSLVEDCRKFLAVFPAQRIQMVLELTERQIIEPTPVSETLFHTLREMGIKISIDDFGTGYSSLAYLRKFRVDNLKIDQSFVAAIGSDTLSRHIIDSIIDLSTKMDLYIVAEGVETREQERYLIEHAVNHLQGYLFSYPLPLQGLVACLQNPPLRFGT